MTIFNKSSRTRGLLPFLTVFLLFTACRGGELCGPLSDPETDVDADCVETDSDDCPRDYNPGQVDIDEDGVGNACDLNDGDSSCGPAGTTCAGTTSSISAPLDGNATYPEPSFLASGIASSTLPSPCRAYLVACGGEFLGYLNADSSDEFSVADPNGDYGSAGSALSILNPLGFYGRDFTSCSAFNADASTPPAIFCESDAGAGEDAFAGYLTLNPLIDDGLNACGVLADLELSPEACD